MEGSSGYVVGVIFIVLVAVIWALASVLVQHIYQDLQFSSPLFLTYICTSLFSIYVPIFQAISYVKSRIRANEKSPLLDPGPYEKSPLVDPGPSSPAAQGEEARLACWKGSWSQHKHVLWLGLMLCPLWFLANVSYNASLLLTSVTSSTVISSASSLFTFLLSALLGTDEVCLSKGAGVLLTVAGTVAVAFTDSSGDDEEQDEDNLLGDAVCLFGAFMYAVYTTFIKVKIPEDGTVPVPLLFGYMGLISFLLLTPVVGVAAARWPVVVAGLTWQVGGWLVVKGLFDNVLSDYLWARAVVLTSPTVATVGLSLTIPMAIISDLVLGKLHADLLYFLGAISVLTGFILVNFPKTKWETICMRKLIGSYMLVGDRMN
eukprot:CAMPEP_0113934354 /NCGR_PEP_ID=MMETSP1339-20121228/1683_1 /TAXON_ID=94617 /ORGANISM="Fibrocapsa japonica" /LENGTH=373 /DNA_ID=CAMNT_0000936125 /DNA_START=150 /DNA_END=1271 /DNA_ORIENTATION=+ /assembly_acc=CAM_ASM_000762